MDVKHAVSLKKGTMRRISGPTRQDAKRGYGKLHSKKLHALYSSPNYQIKGNEVGGVCRTHVGEEKRQDFCAKT